MYNSRAEKSKARDQNYCPSVPKKAQWLSTCLMNVLEGETDSQGVVEYSPECRKGFCIGSCHEFAMKVAQMEERDRSVLLFSVISYFCLISVTNSSSNALFAAR